MGTTVLTQRDSDPSRDPSPTRYTHLTRHRSSSTESIAEHALQLRPQAPNVKLQYFYGRYTENVKAWISLTEDSFEAKNTPETIKVPSISNLFKGEAKT